MSDTQKTIILVGPLPPPIHGVTISTERLLNSELSKKFKLIHLDTSDHRTVDNIGAFDFTNIWLALKSYFVLIYYCLKYRPKIVYIPISQTYLGFMRDSFYIMAPRIM